MEGGREPLQVWYIEHGFDVAAASSFRAYPLKWCECHRDFKSFNLGESGLRDLKLTVGFGLRAGCKDFGTTVL